MTVLENSMTDGVRTLWLNRPKARNAMNGALVSALMDALAAAEEDGKTRVLILRGRGGHFCAGGDIKDMAQARTAEAKDGVDPIAALNARFGELALAFSRSRLPVVAVVEGAVMGGGFGLACTADITWALPSADFRLPETSLGVIPAQIAPFLVERLGFSEAKRLAISGTRIDAEEALRVGLVHRVCTEDALDEALGTLMDQLVRAAPGATAATKKLMTVLYQPVRQAHITQAAEVFAAAARGPEAAEGMAAFLQKRPPSWAKS